jgi:L-lactate utilization protein LutB
VRDEAISESKGGNEFERIRCWDTCTSEAYRRIAGGHNPRAAKGQRLRNRFFCKFYYYPAQYGPMACTGCGRCVELCPVNIDITEVLSHLATTEAMEVTP